MNYSKINTPPPLNPALTLLRSQLAQEIQNNAQSRKKIPTVASPTEKSPKESSTNAAVKFGIGYASFALSSGAFNPLEVARIETFETAEVVPAMRAIARRIKIGGYGALMVASLPTAWSNAGRRSIKIVAMEKTDNVLKEQHPYFYKHHPYSRRTVTATVSGTVQAVLFSPFERAAQVMMRLDPNTGKSITPKFSESVRWIASVGLQEAYRGLSFRAASYFCIDHGLSHTLTPTRERIKETFPKSREYPNAVNLLAMVPASAAACLGGGGFFDHATALSRAYARDGKVLTTTEVMKKIISGAETHLKEQWGLRPALAKAVAPAYAVIRSGMIRTVTVIPSFAFGYALMKAAESTMNGKSN